jgi:protein required for attachment to host cells
MIWVVNTDSNTCRIYHYQKNPAELKLFQEILHPENKLQKKEFVSDRPGHFKSSGDARGAYSQPTDPKDVKIDMFVREIANTLDAGRKSNHFDKLIIIAPPHICGLMNQHLDKHVKKMITNNIQKDFAHASEHELLGFLREHAQFPDS